MKFFRKNIVKHFFVALATFSIFINSFFVLNLKIWQILHHQDIWENLMQQIENERLSVLYVKNVKAFEWLQNSKEFFYRGDLYDIKKVEKKDDTLVIWAFRDFKEKNVINNFVRRTGSLEKLMLLLKNLTSYSLFFSKLEVSITLPPSIKLQVFYSYPVKEIFLSPHFPPPKAHI